MKIGFAVPVSGAWATPANIVEVAATAERLGYSSLWTFQRLLSPVDGHKPLLDPPYRRVHDPITTLAYLAGRTGTIRLGVAILNVPFYSPILLAKSLTTIDHLSDGRLDAGLGIGWLPQEFEATGAPMRNRARRAEEFLTCLKAIWTQDPVEFAGRYYRIPPSHVEPKPVQKPHPPVLLGGTAEAALRRAGRHADGWISSSRADLTRIGESVEIVRHAATSSGRRADRLRFVSRGVVKVRTLSGDGDGERRPLTGSLEQIRDDLAALAHQGITETFLDLNFDPEIGSSEADPAESMRRAHQVLEALAPRRTTN